MTHATSEENQASSERYQPFETMRPTVLSPEDIPPPPKKRSPLVTALAVGVGLLGTLGLFAGYAYMQEFASGTGAVGEAGSGTQTTPAAAPDDGALGEGPQTAWDAPLLPFSADVVIQELSGAAIDSGCVTKGADRIEVEARFTTDGELSSIRIINVIDEADARCLEKAWKKVTVEPFEGFDTNIRAEVQVR